MSELRELLGRMATTDNHFNRYTLLEALVEAVEPQGCPQGCDARIRQLHERVERLRDQRDAWEGRCLKGEEERNEAKTEIKRVELRCEHWTDKYNSVQRELPLAKAKIETLRESRRWWKQRCNNELQRRKEVERLLAAKCKELESYTESVNADADLGKMVRGMRQHTSLDCFARGHYHARAHLFAGYTTIRHDVTAIEALRAIQASE